MIVNIDGLGRGEDLALETLVFSLPFFLRHLIVVWGFCTLLGIEYRLGKTTGIVYLFPFLLLLNPLLLTLLLFLLTSILSLPILLRP